MSSLENHLSIHLSSARLTREKASNQKAITRYLSVDNLPVQFASSAANIQSLTPSHSQFPVVILDCLYEKVDGRKNNDNNQNNKT